jgi:hypothetical protein
MQDYHLEKDIKESERGSGEASHVNRSPLEHSFFGRDGKFDVLFTAEAGFFCM